MSASPLNADILTCANDDIAHSINQSRSGRADRLVIPLRPILRDERFCRNCGQNVNNSSLARARKRFRRPFVMLIEHDGQNDSRARSRPQSLGLGYDSLRLGVPGFLISDFNSRLVVELL